jgi:hypothetical protein
MRGSDRVDERLYNQARFPEALREKVFGRWQGRASVRNSALGVSRARPTPSPASVQRDKLPSPLPWQLSLASSLAHRRLTKHSLVVVPIIRHRKRLPTHHTLAPPLAQMLRAPPQGTTHPLIGLHATPSTRLPCLLEFFFSRHFAHTDILHPCNFSGMSHYSVLSVLTELPQRSAISAHASY